MTGHRENQRWVWVPFEVDKAYDGWRVDRFLSVRLKGYSRSKVQQMLADLRIEKDGRRLKAHSKVRTSDKVSVCYLRRPEAELAGDARVPVLFEDDHLLIVNKPGGLLSHPTDKIVRHTVLGVLRLARPDLNSLHLLHRLDRETSGVLALAKTLSAARGWTKAMTDHRIQKEYIALVRGVPEPRAGVINQPIGRECGAIKVRMAVGGVGAVKAVTRYRVESVMKTGVERWRGGGVEESASLHISTSPHLHRSVVRLFPQTGRLHQIRVHLASIGHPLLGDPLYTGKGELYLKMIQGALTEAERIEALGFPRTALHASALSFDHPATRQAIRVEAPLPSDLQALVRTA